MSLLRKGGDCIACILISRHTSGFILPIWVSPCSLVPSPSFFSPPPFPNSSTVSIPSQAELLETMSLSVVEYRTHAIQRAPALQLSRSGETSSRIRMGEAAVSGGVFSISGGSFTVWHNVFSAPHTPARKWWRDRLNVFVEEWRR